MKIRQHIPASMDFDRESDTNINSVEEILNLPWVKRWEDAPDFLFFCYKDYGHINRPGAPDKLLMVQMNGYHWVLAYLFPDDNFEMTLPEWDGIHDRE